MFEKKKILILGMARSGYEAAKFLSKFDNEIIVVDGKEQNIDHVKELEQLNVKVIITDKQEKLVDDSIDIMIKNPGIKYDNPSVSLAKKLKIPVINELEMSYYFLNKKNNIIAVTGSNGKTTTVTLINEILKAAKLPVHLCGNIGIPLCSIIDEVKPNDILVVEVSDHQLCDMEKFKPNISVLTNISETHIDFHDSYERYKLMKKKIFQNNTESDLAIINFDDEESYNLTKDIKSKKYYFSKEKEEKCYLKENKIYYDRKEVVDTKNIKVRGIHNYENIMAAILVVKQFEVSDEIIKDVLNNFVGVEHRIEYVTTKNGVSFYNDSKSTNNKATMTALSSFNEPIILLMGGLDRGIPFDDLKPYLTNVKKIICFGETKEKIRDFSLQNNIECLIYEDLKTATKVAYSISSSGDVILLSPACASWDQFKCFEDRGNEFKNIVNNL